MEWTDPWHLFPFFILLIAVAIFYFAGFVVEPEDAKKAKYKLDQQKSWENRL